MQISEILQIINSVTLPDNLKIKIGTHNGGKDGIGRTYLQIRQETVCNRTGEQYYNGGRKWDLSYHMTESEIVFTIWKAVLTFTEHELREKFHYKGKKIFDPHISVNALLSVCDQLDIRS